MADLAPINMPLDHASTRPVMLSTRAVAEELRFVDRLSTPCPRHDLIAAAPGVDDGPDPSRSCIPRRIPAVARCRPRTAPVVASIQLRKDIQGRHPPLSRDRRATANAGRRRARRSGDTRRLRQDPGRASCDGHARCCRFESTSWSVRSIKRRSSRKCHRIRVSESFPQHA